MSDKLMTGLHLDSLCLSTTLYELLPFVTFFTLISDNMLGINCDRNKITPLKFLKARTKYFYANVQSISLSGDSGRIFQSILMKLYITV